MSNNDKPPENASTMTVYIMTAYFLLFSLFLIYGMVKFWPSPASTDGDPTTFAVLNFLGFQMIVPDELNLIFVITIAGALGSMVHVLRSFVGYVGAKKFVSSWIPFYILKPYVGSTLGLVFYFIIRGGFFSANASIGDTSPFTFIGLACLVGMFADQASEKLKEIANTIFKELIPGENPLKKDEPKKDDPG